MFRKKGDSHPRVSAISQYSILRTVHNTGFSGNYTLKLSGGKIAVKLYRVPELSEDGIA
jgi:hypothetical protein